MKRLLVALAGVAIVVTNCLAQQSAGKSVPLTFSGGHDIGPYDHGRPCVLIAAALGVKTELFREAFSGVTPAKGRGPSGDEARRNKEALLRVLGPHGVTNERIDEVSNFYRYRPQNHEIWKHKEARAHAIVENGKITKVVIDEAGFGYSTPPKVMAAGMPEAEFTATLQFDKVLNKNGGIKAVEANGRTQ